MKWSRDIFVLVFIVLITLSTIKVHVNSDRIRSAQKYTNDALVECIAEQSSTISSQSDKAVTDSNIIESQIYLFGDDLSIITSQSVTMESQAVTMESQAVTIESQSATMESQSATMESQAVTIASQKAELAQLDAEYDALNEASQRVYQGYLKVCRDVQNMKEYIREIEHQNEQLELLIQAMEEAAAEATDEPR